MRQQLMTYIRNTYLWLILLPLGLGALGIAGNQAVLVANHDKFPVMVSESRLRNIPTDEYGMFDKVHCVMNGDTHLNALADWIDLGDATYSPGDLLIEDANALWHYLTVAWVCLTLRRLSATQGRRDAHCTIHS